MDVSEPTGVFEKEVSDREREREFLWVGRAESRDRPTRGRRRVDHWRKVGSRESKVEDETG